MIDRVSNLSPPDSDLAAKAPPIRGYQRFFADRLQLETQGA
jgi:hypothetical protein